MFTKNNSSMYNAERDVSRLQSPQSPSPSFSISFSKLLNLLLQASQSPTPISFSFPKTTSRRFRQPHARVAVVEHGVVRSDEHVA